jgi:hypothetical protein
MIDNIIIIFIIIIIINYIFVFSITQSVIDYNNYIKIQKNISKNKNTNIKGTITDINSIIRMQYNIIYWRGSIYATILIMIIFIIYNKIKKNNILLDQYITLFLIIMISIYSLQNHFGFHYIKNNYDILQSKIQKIQYELS